MPDSLVQWLDMTPLTWLGCALVLSIGAFVQRATGFGLVRLG